MPLDIGRTIKKLRRESGMSQAELAERLGVTNQAVSKWESGRSLPDITIVPALADVFGVTADFLLGGSGEGGSDEVWEIHTDGYVETSLEKRMDIFLKGLEKMPRSGQLLADAINTGFQLARLYRDRGDPLAEDYFKRTESLCSRLLSSSHEPGEINHARLVLAMLYAVFGKSGKAMELVSRFPSYDSAVSSGAVKAAIEQMTGSAAGEIQARLDNLSQVLLYISNEVYALGRACRKLMEADEKEDGHMARERGRYVWTAEFIKPRLAKSGNFTNLVFSGDYVYYIYYEEAGNFLNRFNLRDNENERVDIPDTGGTRLIYLWGREDGTVYALFASDKPGFFRIVKIGEQGGPVGMTKADGELNHRLLSSFAVDSEENIYLAFSDGVEVFDKNGARLCSLGLKEIRGLVRLPDGRIAATAMNIKPVYDFAEFYAVSPVNIKKRDWDEPVYIESMKVPPQNGRGKYLFFCIDHKDDFLGYNSETREFEVLFSCTELNINISQVLAGDASREGVFRIATVSFRSIAEGGAALELAQVSKKPSVPDERITLEYAAWSLNQTARELIAEFNRTNEKYQIHVTQYMEWDENGNVDYTQAARRLAEAMSSDNPPDIADLQFAPVEFLAYRGLLEDLYLYIDSDVELSRTDFVPSLLKAFEVDGRLCCLAPNVAVSTMLGLPGFTGEKFHMTPDDLKALLDKYPGTSAAHNWTKAGALRILFEHSLPDFVNMKTGECSFLDGEFTKLLEIADRHPSEESGKSLYHAVRDGNILMDNAEILSFLQLQYYRDIFGGDPVFRAYPSRGGNGNILTVHQLYGISSKSRHKDVAWRFIRKLVASGMAGGFPLLKGKLEDMMKREMTANYVEKADVPRQVVPDEKGTGGYKLDKDGRIIRFMMGRRRMKEEVSDRMDFTADMVWIYETCPEDCEKTLGLLNESGRVVAGMSDRQLSDIVVNEAGPYFRGEITAEEAAVAIQAKAGDYLRRFFGDT